MDKFQGQSKIQNENEIECGKLNENVRMRLTHKCIFNNKIEYDVNAVKSKAKFL